MWLSESGGKELKRMCGWNDEVKPAVRIKQAAWKEVLAASDEEAKERCMEVYKKEERKVKKGLYLSKKKDE